MKFQLLGKEIEISEGQKNYLKIVADFENMANRACKGFSTEIVDHLMTIYSKNELNHYYDDFVIETRNYFAKHGVFTISENDISSVITSNSDFSGRSFLQNYFNEVWENIGDNAPNYESSDDRTFYIIKKLDDTIKAGRFNNAIKVDIMALCDYVVEYLSENSVLDIEYVYDEDSKKAKAIYENLVAGNVDLNEGKHLAFSLIELDFSEEDYYRFIFNTYPQAKYDIATITNYIGFDISDLIEKDIKKSFNLKSILSEDDAIKMMSALQEEMKKYGISQCSRKTELEKILKDFDIKARTYDDVLYDTRELCNQAQKDDIMLNELHGVVENLDKSECNKILTEIVHMQCTPNVKNKHLKLLNDRITVIDLEYLKNVVEGIESKSEEECNQLKETISQYDTNDDNKTPYLKKIEECIYKIWDAEDFERFSEIFINTSVTDKQQQVENGKIITETGRTETKNLFFGAICFLNENDIEAAAKYAVAKEGGILSSLINIGKKSTYETLTLNGRVIHPAVTSAMNAIKEKKNEGFLSGLGFKKPKLSIPSFSKSTPSGKKFCTACGAEMNPEAKFCQNCGNKME